MTGLFVARHITGTSANLFSLETNSSEIYVLKGTLIAKKDEPNQTKRLFFAHFNPSIDKYLHP